MKKLEMDEVFDGFMFAQPRGGRYFVPEGWHPLLGLPGAIDTSRGAVLICKLQKPLKEEVQNLCLNGVIEKIRIHRSARMNAPDTMLLLASDLLREFEVCQVPMMSDIEARDLIDAVYDRIGWQHLLAAQKQAIREGPKRNVGSEVDPPEEIAGTIDSAELARVIRSTQTPPSKREQQEQEAMSEQMRKAYDSHQSKKGPSTSPGVSQTQRGSDPVVALMESRGIPVTRESYLSFAYPEGVPDSSPGELEAEVQEALSRAAANQPAPGPQEQQEQESMAEQMARLHASHQSKKGTTS